MAAGSGRVAGCPRKERVLRLTKDCVCRMNCKSAKQSVDPALSPAKTIFEAGTGA